MRKDRLSDDTQTYLMRYEQILREMEHGMTDVSPTDSISEDFIVRMIPHHKAAIEMSRNLLRYSKNDALREIATGIIVAQTESIRHMQNVRARCRRMTDRPDAVREYQRRIDRILATMFSGMRHAPANERIDCDFIGEMIPHHAGAVAMSETALGYAICPELKPILTTIIEKQKRGIAELRELQRTLRC